MEKKIKCPCAREPVNITPVNACCSGKRALDKEAERVAEAIKILTNALMYGKRKNIHVGFK